MEQSNIIINRNEPIPGVLHTEEQVKKQKDMELKKKTEAAKVIQKWGRGMLDRRKASRVRSRMKREIEMDFNDYAHKFKANSQFNLEKFLQMKKKVRF